MAQTVYSGSFGGVSAGSLGKTTALTKTSGNYIPPSAVISAVSFSLRLTATAWSSAYDWDIYWYKVDDPDGPSVTGSPWSSNDMADDEVTLVKSLPITPTYPFIMNVSFDVAVKANNDHPTSTSYMWETSVTITYEIPTACTAPTTVSISDQYPLPSTDGTLSWSGAAPGT
ncbi:MAG: hypothetical protein WC455_23625, partial [Dehalococcoidia bacterium]